MRLFHNLLSLFLFSSFKVVTNSKLPPFYCSNSNGSILTMELARSVFDKANQKKINNICMQMDMQIDVRKPKKLESRLKIM